MPEAPVLVLLAATGAAAMWMIEAALPTFGVAGLIGVVLAAAAVLALGDEPWWPLAFAMVAVAVWAVALAVRRAGTVLPVSAATLFAVGSIGYGIAAQDWAAFVVAVTGSVALPSFFPRLQRATRRLVSAPPQTGMAALLGRHGEVVRLSEGVGTVRIDGSLWNARSSKALSPGVDVEVLAWDGMTLEVTLPATADE
jgi:membrane protein implicated in regulation of membrane protease activity